MTDNQTMSKPREFEKPEHSSSSEYRELYSAYEALKIDNNSWQNCQRKLNEANERIVEFESIKSGHLKIQEEMQKQLAAAKAEVEELKQELSENQMSCSSQHKADHEYQIELEEEIAAAKADATKWEKHHDEVVEKAMAMELKLRKQRDAEKAKSAKLVELLERAKGTVVTHAMQTYSKVSDRLAAEINEAIAEYSAGNESSKGDGNA